MIFKMLTNSNQIWYEGVFGVTERESEVRFKKFKIAVSIWQNKNIFKNCENFIHRIGTVS